MCAWGFLDSLACVFCRRVGAAQLGIDSPIDRFSITSRSFRIARREFAVTHVIYRAALIAALAWLSVPGQKHVGGEMPDVLQPNDVGSPVSLVWHDNLDEGWRESKRRGLPMVVFITSDNCVYCDAMKKDTWCDGEVLGQLRQNFVAIQLKRDRDSELLSRIKVPSYPMTLVASPEGKVMDQRIGYQPPEQVRKLFSDIAQRHRR